MASVRDCGCVGQLPFDFEKSNCKLHSSSAFLSINSNQFNYDSFKFGYSRPFSFKMNLFSFAFHSLLLLQFFFFTSTSALSLFEDLAGRAGNRIHRVQQRLGEPAYLPCEVRTEQCGSVYFITWARNSSAADWQRIFVWSSAQQRPLIDNYNKLLASDRQLPSNSTKLQFDGSNLTADGVAYLRLDNLSPDDDGLFKCDVTYLQSKCPSLTYTHLTTLVTPGMPIIRVNGLDMPEDSNSASLSLEEGSSVTLECSSSGGRPTPGVLWLNDSQPLNSKLVYNQEAGVQTVTAVYRFVLSRFDLASRFHCQVWNNATFDNQLVAHLALDVQVKPTQLSIVRPPMPVVAGEMVQLTCTVEGARPFATISWYNRSDFAQQAPVENTELMPDGTYRTTSTLVFIASRYDDNGDFFCKGINQVLKNRNEAPLIQTTSLQVLYPPHVWIESNEASEVNEGQPAALVCRWSSNPTNLTDLQFTFTPDPQQSPPLPLSTSGLFQRNAHVVRLGSNAAQLTMLTIGRNQSGHYGCIAANAFGRTSTLHSVPLIVRYPPVVSIKVLPTSTSGQIRLRCVVLSGQPRRLLKVQWFRNDQHFASTPTPYYSAGSAVAALEQPIQPDILVLSNTTDLSSNFSCSGYNGINRFGPISTPKRINLHEHLHQDPLLGVEQNAIINAVRGSRLQLNCSRLVPILNSYDLSLYAPLVKWRLNGRPLAGFDQNELSLTLDKVDLPDEGNYTCEVFHPQTGQRTSGFAYLKVNVAPRIISGLSPFVGLSGDNQTLTLNCRFECEPRCQIRWLKNNQTLSASERSLYAIYTQQLEPEPETNLLASSSSYLQLHEPQFLREGDQLACRAESNSAGPTQTSTTTYRLESAPRFLESIVSTPSSGVVELLEGQLLSNGLVDCAAVAFPPPSFSWTRHDPTSASIQSLGTPSASSLLLPSQLLSPSYSDQGQWRAHRSMAGNYTCTATNKLGQVQRQIVIQVYYRPECSVTKETISNGEQVMVCHAASSPPALNFTWYRQLPSSSYAIQTNQSANSLPVALASAFAQQRLSVVAYGARLSLPADVQPSEFTCVVSNAMGSSSGCSWTTSGSSSNDASDSSKNNRGLDRILGQPDYLMLAAVGCGVFGFLLVCLLIVCTVCCVLKRRNKPMDATGGHVPKSGALPLQLPAGATYGLMHNTLLGRTIPKYGYGDTQTAAYGNNCTLPSQCSDEKCKLALYEDEDRSITDGRSSDYHTYCDAETLRLGSTNRLFQSGANSLVSANRIYGGAKTSSQNSTSPLITRGQQLLLSSNEEDDEDSDLTAASRLPMLDSRPINGSQSETQSELSNNSNQMNPLPFDRSRSIRQMNTLSYVQSAEPPMEDAHHYYEPMVNRRSNLVSSGQPLANNNPNGNNNQTSVGPMIAFDRRIPQPPERSFQRLQSPAYATLGNGSHALSAYGAGTMRPVTYGTAGFGAQSPAYSTHLYNTLSSAQRVGSTSKRRAKH